MLLVLTVTRTEQQWDPPTTIVNVRPAGQQYQRARGSAASPSPPSPPAPPPSTPPPPSPLRRARRRRPPARRRHRRPRRRHLPLRRARRRWQDAQATELTHFGDRMPVEPCAYEREALPLPGYRRKTRRTKSFVCPRPGTAWQPPPRLLGAEPCGDEYARATSEPLCEQPATAGEPAINLDATQTGSQRRRRCRRAG